MRAQRGYSLVEVIVAFGVVTLVITISFAAFLERTRRLQQASEITLAYQALANEAEYRRRIEFGMLETAPADFMSDVAVLEPLRPYVATTTVVRNPSGTKNVTMSIRWRDGEREAKLALVRVDTGGTGLW